MVNAPLIVEEDPPALVTTTSWAPAAMLEVWHLMEVALELVTEQELPPMVTVAGETNPEPDMVTFVPPAVGPEAG